MKAAAPLAVAAALLVGCGEMSDESAPETPSPSGAGAASVLEHTVATITGEPKNLADYKGKVVLVVNTATECGFTPQFEGLEKLYEQKKDEGFVILGFPADDVANQEPREDEAIAEFCEQNFGVSFPMFEKSNLVSDPQNPVYAELNEAVGRPGWNFNKVLLDREGKPLQRFGVQTAPEDPTLVDAIDEQLKRG